jgi:hypothetical protein
LRKRSRSVASPLNSPKKEKTLASSKEIELGDHKNEDEEIIEKYARKKMNDSNKIKNAIGLSKTDNVEKY